MCSSTFPDGRINVTYTGCDSANSIFVCYDFFGTMKGAFPSAEGTAATNKNGSFKGVAHFYTDSSGKISRVEVVANYLQLLTSVGLVQPLSSTTGMGMGMGGKQQQGMMMGTGATGQPAMATGSYGTGGTGTGTGGMSSMDQQARTL